MAVQRCTAERGALGKRDLQLLLLLQALLRVVEFRVALPWCRELLVECAV